MGDQGGCCLVAVPVGCHCPRGVWPACGVAEQCGYWEGEARRQGVRVETVEGLRLTETICVAGVAFILISDWRSGEFREDAICRGLCELHRRGRGIEDARQQIRHSVAVLAEAC